MSRLNSTGRTVENLREIGRHVEAATKWALRNGVYRVVTDAKNRGYRYGKVIEYANNREKAFLPPALDANRQQIRENIKYAVRQAIRRGH